MGIFKNNRFLKIAAVVLALKILLLGIFLVPAKSSNETSKQLPPEESLKAKPSETTEEKYSANSGKSFSVLAENERELERRYTELNEKEEKIKLADEEMKGKLAELKKLRTEIESLLKVKEQKDEQRIAHLVKIYSSMKSDEAAQIIDKLPEDIVVEMFSKMKGDQVAKILGLISKEKAVRITGQLTGTETESK